MSPIRRSCAKKVELKGWPMGIFQTNPVFYLSFISALKRLITEQGNSKHFTYVQIYEYTQTTYLYPYLKQTDCWYFRTHFQISCIWNNVHKYRENSLWKPLDKVGVFYWVNFSWPQTPNTHNCCWIKSSTGNTKLRKMDCARICINMQEYLEKAKY